MYDWRSAVERSQAQEEDLARSFMWPSVQRGFNVDIAGLVYPVRTIVLADQTYEFFVA